MDAQKQMTVKLVKTQKGLRLVPFPDPVKFEVTSIEKTKSGIVVSYIPLKVKAK